MNRLRVGGLTLAGTGALLLGWLFASGSIRTPTAAIEATHPIEYAAIAVALSFVTVGVVVAFATYVET